MIKKITIIYVILALAVLIAGGVVWYGGKGDLKKNNLNQPAVQPLNTNTNNNQLPSQISVNEPAVKQNQPELTNTSAQIIPSAKTDCADELDTTCWNTYRNTEYGLEFKYPRGLTADSGRLIVKEANIDVKYVSFKFLNGKYILLFYFAKGEPNASLNSRTGFGSGDFVSANREIKFGPAVARVNYLIYQNKIKEIYYSRKASALFPYDNIRWDNYIFRAELTFGNNSDIKYNQTLANVPEVYMMEKILETLKLL